MEHDNNNGEETERSFVNKGGITYFSKRTERRIYFLLTMAMLIWGMVEYARGLF